METWSPQDEPDISAETEYLFRHATVRDAAYQLLPVSQRARLHGTALDILEESAMGHTLEIVMELAEHARLAQVGVTIFASELPLREIRYLRLAARHSAAKYENEHAARLWETVGEHPRADNNEKAEALIEAGLMHWMLGRRDRALEVLTRALELDDVETRHRAYCLIERGTLHRDVRDNVSAVHDLESALELARESGQRALELRALGNLCTIRDTQLSPEDVKELYAPVLALAADLQDTRAAGITEGQIGIASARADHFAMAEQHLERSIEKLREAGDRVNETAMIAAVGRLYLMRTDGDRRLNLMRAVKHFQDSVKIKEELGYLFQKAEPLLGLAAAHRELGTLSEAGRYARRALDVAQEVGDPESIGNAFLEIGRVHEAAGDTNEAERAYSYGFMEIEGTGAENAKVDLLSALATLMAGQGDWEDAQSHARNAVELSAKSGDKRTRTRTRMLLRNIRSRRLGNGEDE